MNTLLFNILLLCVVWAHAQSDTLPPEGYGAKIREADVAFDAKNFIGAKTLYQQALIIQPGEQYPKDGIQKCDAWLVQNCSDGGFQSVIHRADSLFATGNFDAARALYSRALIMKPNEEYPKTMIEKCKPVCSDVKFRREYVKAVVAGDSAFVLHNYSVAKAHYTLASALLSSEQYPVKRIAECDEFLKED